MADDNKIIAEILVEGVDQFKASLKGAQGSVEQLNAEVAQTGDVSKQAMTEAAQSTASYRTQLKNMTSDLVGLNLQLAEMKDAGKAGTKEFTELEKRIDSLRKKAGELKDAMQDAGDQIKATGSDTAGLDKAIRVVGSASAAFQVFEGAATLAGKGSEDLQKALVRLNGVMAITQGLQQIQNELVRDDSVFKGMATKATALYNIVVGQSTGALKLFRLALAGTGIGLAILAISELVKYWGLYGDKLDETKPKVDDMTEAKQKLLDVNKQEIDDLNEELKLRIALGEITPKQADEARLLELKRQQAQAAINLGKAQRDFNAEQSKQFTNIKDIVEQNKRLEKLNKNVVVAEQVWKESTIAYDDAKKSLDKYNTTASKTSSITNKIAENFGGILVELKRQPDVMREAINLFNEYGRVTARSADQAEAAAKRITAAQDAIQESVSGGNVSRATGSQTQEDLLQAQFEKAQEYYGLIQDAAGQTSQIIQNFAKNRAATEIQELDRKKDRGLISEKQYQKELAKIKNDEARKDRRATVINAFLAVPQAILAGLIKGGPILAAVYGALATVQAAAIAAAPLPKFRDGGSVAKRLGLIKGKSHEAGGVPIEVEGDEFVMSKKAVKHYGVDFMDKVNNMKLSPVVTMSPKLEQMKQTDYKLYEHLATLGGYMKQDYRTNERALNVLAEINQGVRAGRKRYV